MKIRCCILIILTLIIPILVHGGSGGPKITLEKEILDYGKVMYGDTISQEFVVKNTGAQTLIIDKVEASCGCTKTIKGTSEIPPDGETKIVASFDTNGMRAGKKQKTISLHSNDPEKPVTKLVLMADVVKDLNFEPLNLSMKLPEFKEKVVFPVKVSNDSDIPYEIKRLSSVNGNSDLKMTPESLLLNPHSVQLVEFTLSLQRQSGKEYYIGRFTIETNHPKERDIELRYIVKIDKPA
jgi:hypothetical protein